MDEEIAIIDTNTRNEKIKNFFLVNKKKIITLITSIILIVLGCLFYYELDKKIKIKLAENYNTATINFISGDKKYVKEDLVKIIYEKDKTYSPLALYFLIDNKIISLESEIDKLFEFIINEVDLEYEIKNLLIFKKALFNSDSKSGNELIKILEPIIFSESIWKSDALFLIAEFYFSKNEKQNAKEFFLKILEVENANPNIKLEAQKRLNRDFSE